MNSLRARLIWGFSLVAVVPLALALALLGTRIHQTMEQQAAERLDAAIRVARGELVDDGQRLAARVALLARDAQLKRLYLVDAAGGLELRQFLAEQRFLSGLDYLVVGDSTGQVIADASLAAPVGGRAAADPLDTESLPAASDSGLAIRALVNAPGLALDALAPIPYAGERVGFVRGGVRVDSTFLARLQRLSGLELLLRDGRGRVLATTLKGGEAPVMRPADPTVGRVRLAGHTYLTREMDLRLGPGGVPPRLTALASTGAADDAVAVLTSTAVALGLLGVLLAIVLGVVWSHQVASPVVRLAGYSERISRGDWDEPLAMESMRELQTLVDAFERMRHDLKTYRDHLRASERQAAYGQMARKVAHELKNPLTPIALSVQGLKRSYDQKHADFGATLNEAVRVVAEEVQRLKALLQEFNELGRFPQPRPVPFVVGELMGDLRTLFHHEVVAGRLAFDLPPAVMPVVADPGQLRQALLNLIQNGLDASAVGAAGEAGAGHVRVTAAAHDNTLYFAVSDDGPGMSESERAQLFVPGFTTKTHGTGLGLTIVERIISDHKGTIEVDSAPGRGTSFVIQIPAKQET
jgi:nitrogen fixation/metabolism regulation signal transduction histidine kinase